MGCLALPVGSKIATEVSGSPMVAALICRHHMCDKRSNKGDYNYVFLGQQDTEILEAY